MDYREYDSTSGNDWIDRIYSTAGTWSGNVFDFFYLVSERLYTRIKVPFKLELVDHVMTRVGETPMHIAIREALVNCITNADFFIPSGIVVINKPDFISISNTGDIRVGKNEMLTGGVSDARNKSLMKMFNLLGIGERAGSGVPRIFDTWLNLVGALPSVREDFKNLQTVLILPIQNKASDKTSDKIHENAQYKDFEVSSKMIIEYLKEHGVSKASDISCAINLGPSRTRQVLSLLCESGEIFAIGVNRGRKYSVKKD